MAEKTEKDEKTQATPEPTGVISAPGAAPAGAAPAPGAAPNPDETDEDVEARLAYESLMRHRKARRRKKVIAASVVGGVALIAAIAWGVLTSQANQAAEAPQLQTMPVFRGEFSESVQATGSAQPLSSVVVTPEVDGIIETVNVAEGSVVQEGDVLLTVRNDELDRAVREAEIGVRSAKAGVSSAQEAYNQTYKEYCKGPTYVDNGDGTTTEVPASATWADVQQAATQIDSAKLTLEGAQQTYDQAVSTAAKRTVKAPASGSVVVMNAVQGAALGAGGAVSGGDGSSSGTLIQIADLSQMTVKVQVNEVDISRIAVGQGARVTFSALPDALLDAQVTRISTVSAADPYGYNYGVVTYDVELLIPDPVLELKPGMTASVEILLQHVPDAMTVPVSALATDDGLSYYVYVMTDAEAQACERRDVTVTAQSSTTAAVEGDLADGDLVVLDPYSVTNVSGGEGGAAGGGLDAASDAGDAAGEQDGALAADDADATVSGGAVADDLAVIEGETDAATADAVAAEPVA
ncbi:efflux RND transporter periplasmic adaptor subunit [Thermophilibacter sp. ET337]|uniref:efflux RND transporter periplasmic adaptor subunit n=1 Tax=Thermophilibacter sp. ET337 TaxID=2973084 RepID=UPI0021AD15AD|nr:efflux RND transporter periplasmic adaptor subunit [Thermophilibacter sp. ET337]MCR8907150.1 efflux RND transporter periplasmic adaptor subunit [Thermophilibacter sp. ET337]